MNTLQKAGRLDDPESSLVIYHLAGLYLETGRASSAVPLLRRFQRIIELKSASDPLAYAQDLAILGRMYVALRKPDESLSCLQKATTMLQRLLDPNDARIPLALTARAGVLSMLGRHAGAITDIEQAIAISESLSNLPARSSIDLWTTAGMVYAQARRAGQAELSFQKAIELAEANFGPTHPVLALVLRANSLAFQRLGRKREAKALEKRSDTILAQNGLQPPLTVDVSTLSPLGRTRK